MSGQPKPHHPVGEITESTDPESLLTAVRLLGMGLWPVAITALSDQTTANPGKAPIGFAWGKHEPTEESLRGTWLANPGAGVGLKLGPRGMVVDLEIDDRAIGEDTLLDLLEGEDVPTLGWESSRGMHRLFRFDPRLAKYGKNIVKVGGVEIRINADDKQLQSVVPPSPTSDGKPRQWNGCWTIAELPEIFYDKLDAKLIESGAIQPPSVIPIQGRTKTANEAIKRLLSPKAGDYGQAALQGEIDRVLSATEGGRNAALNVAALKLGKIIGAGKLGREEVETALHQAAVAVGLDESEIGPTMRSGLAKGMQEPRIIEPMRSSNGHDGASLGGGNGDNNGDPPASATSPDSPEDPHRLAQIFLDDHQYAGHQTLYFWLEEWHRWDRMSWKIIGSPEIISELTRTCKREFDRIAYASGALSKPVTTRLIGNVMLALKSLALLRSADCPKQPRWLDGNGPDPLGCLPASNGILNLAALVDGEPNPILPPTPRFFSPTNLGYEVDLKAPAPAKWLAFLDSIWGDDRESIDCLQEWFGYFLTPDTSQQKILITIGPKRSGKGTIAKMVAALVGHANVTSPTLSGLGRDYGMACMIGKTVAVIGDARLSGRVDGQAIVERLLSISGEDRQAIPRKYLNDWDGQLHTRFALFSNELPRLGDSSGAMPSRAVILRMTKTFFGHEDHGLYAKLLGELPSILLWSIAGWERLRSRGRFVQPSSAAEYLDELEELSSPIGQFIHERCTLGPDETIGTKELYAAWRKWCEEHGKKEPGDTQSFGRALRAAMPTLKVTQPREGGSKVRKYVGLSLVLEPAF